MGWDGKTWKMMMIGNNDFPKYTFGRVYNTWQTKSNITNKMQMVKKEKKIRDYLKTFDTIDYFKFMNFRTDFHTENSLKIFDDITEVMEKFVTCTEDYSVLNGRMSQIITSMLTSVCRTSDEDEELAILIELLSP